MPSDTVKKNHNKTVASSKSRAAGKKAKGHSSHHKKKKKKKGASRALIALWLVVVLALLGAIVYLLFFSGRGDTRTPAPTEAPVVTAEPTQEAAAATATPVPTPTVLATPSPAPTPTPMPIGHDEINAANINDAQKPSNYRVNTKVYANGQQVSTYTRQRPISIASSERYASLEGVTTFRGNNYRDTGSYGYLPDNASQLHLKYQFKIGGLDEWTGVGWTGQPAIVRWDDVTRGHMNIYEAKKQKAGLVEVIYATLEGKIYFFDLEDGEPTRDPIRVPGPIKGSVTVDPRGYPLLYVGQGIEEVHGTTVKIGMRIFSLIDQSELLFINGRDQFATRHWYASDCAPIIDTSSDTCIWAGENGLLYTIALNSVYDKSAGTMSISPVIDRYWYESSVTTRPGMENSVAVYNHYAYFTDNSGLLTCLDLNTMSPVWTFYTGDDSDCSIVVEQNNEGVFLYTGTELDLSAKNGSGQIHMRCLNALTGDELWIKTVGCNDSEHGGCFATPCLGKGAVSDLVFFTVAKTTGEEYRNITYALNKRTGNVVWAVDDGGYCWSSPTLSFDQQGNAYLFQCNSNSMLKMYNAVTGDKITEIEVDGSNIEGSPAIFNNMLVIGTRGEHICGVIIE